MILQQLRIQQLRQKIIPVAKSPLQLLVKVLTIHFMNCLQPTSSVQLFFRCSYPFIIRLETFSIVSFGRYPSGYMQRYTALPDFLPRRFSLPSLILVSIISFSTIFVTPLCLIKFNCYYGLLIYKGIFNIPLLHFFLFF